MIPPNQVSPLMGQDAVPILFWKIRRQVDLRLEDAQDEGCMDLIAEIDPLLCRHTDPNLAIQPQIADDGIHHHGHNTQYPYQASDPQRHLQGIYAVCGGSLKGFRKPRVDGSIQSADTGMDLGRRHIEL